MGSYSSKSDQPGNNSSVEDTYEDRRDDYNSIQAVYSRNSNSRARPYASDTSNWISNHINTATVEPNSHDICPPLSTKSYSAASTSINGTNNLAEEALPTIPSYNDVDSIKKEKKEKRICGAPVPLMKLSSTSEFVYRQKSKNENMDLHWSRNRNRNRKSKHSNIQLYRNKIERVGCKVKDQTQNHTYIDLLDEFLNDPKLSNTNFDWANSEVNTDEFITYAGAFEAMLNKLEVSHEDKSTIVEKLGLLREAISSKIEFISSGADDKVKKWMNSSKKTDEIPSLLNLKFSSRENNEATSVLSGKIYASDNQSVKSALSSQSLLNDVSSEVNCQFCNERRPDMTQLVTHLDTECKKFRYRSFEVKPKNDYSYFQILPNDAIKCGLCESTLDGFFRLYNHRRSSRHQQNMLERKRLHAEGGKGRKAIANTDFLFCSCCKVNVPDTLIQYEMHIKNEEHVLAKSSRLSNTELIRKRILFSIVSTDNVECLLCRLNFQFEFSKLQNHCDDDVHKMHMKRKRIDEHQLIKIYCVSCAVELKPCDCGLHIKSPRHTENSSTDKNGTKMKHVYCIFCDLQKCSLKELAVHMESDCDKLNERRRALSEGSKPMQQASREQQVQRPKLDILQPIVLHEEAEPVNELATIIVKDVNNLKSGKIQEYFQQYGRIRQIFDRKLSNRIDIEFEDEAVARTALEWKDMIIIDGEKVEILKFKRRIEPVTNDEPVFELADICKQILAPEKIEQYVLELCKTIERLDESTDDSRIANEISSFLKASEFRIIGLKGCGISYPRGQVDISFQFALPISQLKNIQKNLIKIAEGNLKRNDKVSAIITKTEEDVPYIHCSYEGSHTCRLTFLNHSGVSRTDLIKNFIEVDGRVKPFLCLLVFWANEQKLKDSDQQLFSYQMVNKVLVVMAISFLQSDGVDVLPKTALDHPLHLSLAIADSRRANVQEVPHTPYTVGELFHKFLDFYISFDYEKDVICAPLARPLPRSLVRQELSKLGEGVDVLKKNFTDHECLCVMDPLEHGINIAKGIDMTTLRNFLKLARLTREL